jgi:acyl-CoA thioesterase FadM
LLEIELTMEDLKQKSVKYGFKVFNKETAVLLAVGNVVVVVADKKTETAVQIPKEIAEKLRQFSA